MLFMLNVATAANRFVIAFASTYNKTVAESQFLCFELAQDYYQYLL
jgi:hypothetical protein